MKTLWAPWRFEYVVGPKADACAFCNMEDSARDRENLVLWRGETCFAAMNRYPYSCGHLLIVPYRHVADLTDLIDQECTEVMLLARQSASALRQAFKPDGINTGMNLGQAAGAGIGSHVHLHLVPRWNGDHSFMAVFGQTMVLSEHLESQFDRLQPFFGFDTVKTA